MEAASAAGGALSSNPVGAVESTDTVVVPKPTEEQLLALMVHLGEFAPGFAERSGDGEHGAVRVFRNLEGHTIPTPKPTPLDTGWVRERGVGRREVSGKDPVLVTPHFFSSTDCCILWLPFSPFSHCGHSIDNGGMELG